MAGLSKIIPGITRISEVGIQEYSSGKIMCTDLEKVHFI